MDFRLRVFLAVAKNLSFTRASKELFISQPAITKHIQELENSYMVQLFSRQGGRIELTPQGELFRIHAQRIIEEYEELQYRMSLSRDALEGEFRIGISTGIARQSLQKVMEAMERTFPGMHISYIIDDTSRIKEAVEDKSIDMGILDSDGVPSTLLKEMDEKGEKITSFVHRLLNGQQACQ